MEYSMKCCSWCQPTTKYWIPSQKTNDDSCHNPIYYLAAVFAVIVVVDEW